MQECYPLVAFFWTINSLATLLDFPPIPHAQCTFGIPCL